MEIHTIIVVDTDTGEATPYDEWPDVIALRNELESLRRLADKYHELLDKIDSGGRIRSKKTKGGTLHYWARVEFEPNYSNVVASYREDPAPDVPWNPNTRKPRFGPAQ